MCLVVYVRASVLCSNVSFRFIPFSFRFVSFRLAKVRAPRARRVTLLARDSNSIWTFAANVASNDGSNVAMASSNGIASAARQLKATQSNAELHSSDRKRATASPIRRTISLSFGAKFIIRFGSSLQLSSRCCCVQINIIAFSFAARRGVARARENGPKVWGSKG